MSLSVIIVDDEQLARDELSYLLRDVEDLDVIGQGKNGVEAVNLIKEISPDLVFLDVQMPGLDGFGVIKKLLEKKIPLPEHRLHHGLRPVRGEGLRGERAGLRAEALRQEAHRAGGGKSPQGAGAGARRRSDKAGHPGEAAGAAEAADHARFC